MSFGYEFPTAYMKSTTAGLTDSRVCGHKYRVLHRLSIPATNLCPRSSLTNYLGSAIFPYPHKTLAACLEEPGAQLASPAGSCPIVKLCTISGELKGPVRSRSLPIPTTMLIVTPVLRAIQTVAVFTWDFGLEIVNAVTPKRKVGHVTPEGEPGAGGKWPEYIAPKEGDIRCCCPALNAMANHGIIPRDGKNIKFSDMPHKLNATYNFAPSFTFFVPNLAANMLKKDYYKDTFDLSDLDLHNGIEHDASLTREDTGIVSSQAKPHVPFIKELLASASGKDDDGNALLTAKDISEYSAKRRVEARATNPEFSLTLAHKLVGSSNASGFLTIFGGRVDDIESILIEERIPDGWESRIRKTKGLTFAAFNPVVYKVERGIDEEKYKAKIAAEAAAAVEEVDIN